MNKNSKTISNNEIEISRRLYYEILCHYLESDFLNDLNEFYKKNMSSYRHGIEDEDASVAFTDFIRKREKIIYNIPVPDKMIVFQEGK